MLASVIGLYVESAKTEGGPTYLVSRAGRRSTSAPTSGAGCSSASSSRSRSRRRCSRCTPGCPDAAAERDAGHLGAAGQRARQDRHLRDDPVLPRAVPRGVAVGDAGGGRAGRRSASCTARCMAIGSGQHPAADRLHVGVALRLHRAGHLRDEQPGPVRLEALHVQPRALDGGAVPGHRLPDHAPRLGADQRLRRRREGRAGAGRHLPGRRAVVAVAARACRRSSPSSW